MLLTQQQPRLWLWQARPRHRCRSGGEQQRQQEQQTSAAAVMMFCLALHQPLSCDEQMLAAQMQL